MKEKLLEVIKNPKVIVAALATVGVVAGLVAANQYIKEHVDDPLDQDFDDFVNPDSE